MDADPKHRIVSDIKRVAQELGHVPTREEYRAHGRESDRSIRGAFGGFAVALQGAGLEPKQPPKKYKITAEDLFGEDVREAVARPRQDLIGIAPLALPDDFARTVVFGDTHFPFVNQRALGRALEFVGDTKPSRAVQIGDLYDLYAQTKFARSLNLYNPFEEIRLGREMALKFWADVQRLSPGIECHQIKGNHDVRPLKRIREACPEAEPFFNIDPWFEFPEVATIHDPRQELILQGVCFQHGHYGKLGDHLAYNLMNTVHGHTHRAGLHYRQVRGVSLFEMDVGYLGDEDSKVMGYTSQRMTKSTLALGEIDRHGPRLVML